MNRNQLFALPVLFVSSMSVVMAEPCEEPKKASEVQALSECIGGPEGLQKLAVRVDGETQCVSTLEWAKDESWAEKKVQIYFQLEETPEKNLTQKVASAFKKKQPDSRLLRFSQNAKCFPSEVAVLGGRYSTSQLKAACGTFYPESDDNDSHIKTSLLNHLHLGEKSDECDLAVRKENKASNAHNQKKKKALSAEKAVIRARIRVRDAEDSLRRKQQKAEKKNKILGTASARDPKISGQQGDTPFKGASGTASEQPTNESANKAAP